MHTKRKILWRHAFVDRATDLRAQSIQLGDCPHTSRTSAHMYLGGSHRFVRQLSIDVTIKNLTELFAVHAYFTLTGLAIDT